MVATWSRIVQGKNERMWSYIDSFTQFIAEVEGYEEGHKC